MKKQQTQEPPLENHLHRFTDDHPLMEWLQNNGKTLLLSLLGLLLLLFIAYRISSNGNTRAEANYYEASQLFTLFQKNGDAEAFSKLQTILDNHPELHAKYDGQIAQLFITRNDPNAAQPYADLVFNRIRSDDISYYEKFSTISLLISKGNFAEALQQSKELKNTLLNAANNPQQERTFGDLLFAYNLLRIAMLEQKAGTPQGELDTWSEWNTYSTASTNSASIKAAPFYTLDALFGEGELTLNGYIKSRQEGSH